MVIKNAVRGEINKKLLCDLVIILGQFMGISTRWDKSD
jgi:hypothetical protein